MRRILDHKNIVQYINTFEGVLVGKAAASFDGDSATVLASLASTPRLWLCSERMAFGSLGDMMRRKQAFAEPHVANVLRAVLAALGYLHDAGRVHRAVSPDAVFICADGRVKLGDLSLCAELGARVTDTPVVLPRDLRTNAATAYWLAPELADADAAYAHKIDVFSAVLLVHALLVHRAPLADSDPAAAVAALVRARQSGQLPPAYTNLGVPLSPLLDSFLVAGLCVPPEQRPSAASLQHHAFLRVAAPRKSLVAFLTAK